MTIEFWKDIKGYEGKYQVSNLGRVRSKIRGKNLIMKSRLDRYGYHRVSFTITLNGVKSIKTHHVHKLVAEAFIHNPHNLETVNHRDLDKNNNKAENLEWLSRRDNTLHMVYNRYYKGAKLRNTVNGDEYLTLKDASDKTGIPYSTLCECARQNRIHKYNIEIKQTSTNG